jgi:hypothetical protein
MQMDEAQWAYPNEVGRALDDGNASSAGGLKFFTKTETQPLCGTHHPAQRLAKSHQYHSTQNRSSRPDQPRFVDYYQYW